MYFMHMLPHVHDCAPVAVLAAMECNMTDSVMNYTATDGCNLCYSNLVAQPNAESQIHACLTVSKVQHAEAQFASPVFLIVQVSRSAGIRSPWYNAYCFRSQNSSLGSERALPELLHTCAHCQFVMLCKCRQRWHLQQSISLKTS